MIPSNQHEANQLRAKLLNEPRTEPTPEELKEFSWVYEALQTQLPNHSKEIIWAKIIELSEKR